ncbi:unnamed protein product, partial [Laminaria digitata]
PLLHPRPLPPSLHKKASRAVSMTVSPASASETQQQQRGAETFDVDFEGVQEAFGRGGAAARAGAGVRLVAGAGAAALAPLVLGAAEASAKGGEFGIVEGRTASFLHPIIMGTLFTVSLRAAILGLEWREQRTMSTRMSTLKEQLPMLSSGSRASTPLKKQADGIRETLSELGEDAAGVAASLKADLGKP